MEIIADILQFCNNRGRTKTSIMHKANLNHPQMQTYLSLLNALEMLRLDENRYFTVEKGHHFLELFAPLQSLLSTDT